MTVWDVRRAKRFGTEGRLLCGFTVDGKYRCPEQVAHDALWSADEQDLPARGEVWLPVGLTDDGTPRDYRWSTYAAGRIKRGENPSLGRGGGATRAVQLAEGPIIVPCRKGHRNRVT